MTANKKPKSKAQKIKTDFGTMVGNRHNVVHDALRGFRVVVVSANFLQGEVVARVVHSLFLEHKFH
ncbi:MAG: hypothetical protein WBP65_08575 [Candidatus Sulfotelmatobacter sp.]|jgi:hypothetical protein